MNFIRIAVSTFLITCSCMVFGGAWDVGPFDNDDALDWVWELSESEDLSILENALQAANNSSGYLEAPTASVALAAAEVVAALRGKPRAQLPAEVTVWVEKHDADVDKDLVLAARKAIVHVENTESSELAQLWSDSDELLEQWRRELADLASRLK